MSIDDLRGRSRQEHDYIYERENVGGTGVSVEFNSRFPAGSRDEIRRFPRDRSFLEQHRGELVYFVGSEIVGALPSYVPDSENYHKQRTSALVNIAREFFRRGVDLNDCARVGVDYVPEPPGRMPAPRRRM